jgi:hypothetical protein
MTRFVSILLLASFLIVVPARAEETMNVTGKRVKVVARSALYGLGGGLVVGLASQVFERKTKNIFMFGSLGMYAGILLGIYVVSTSSGPRPYEGPDTYEDFSHNKKGIPGTLAYKTEDLKAASDLQVNFLSFEF